MSTHKSPLYMNPHSVFCMQYINVLFSSILKCVVLQHLYKNVCLKKRNLKKTKHSIYLFVTKKISEHLKNKCSGVKVLMYITCMWHILLTCYLPLKIPCLYMYITATLAVSLTVDTAPHRVCEVFVVFMINTGGQQNTYNNF